MGRGPPRWAVRVCHGGHGILGAETRPPEERPGTPPEPGRAAERRPNRRRRNRAGACAALGREPRRALRVRAGSPGARLRAVATDGTREHLAADGIEAASVSDLTAVPPLVGGQVRTFHPAIYAGILARRDGPEQLEQLAEHGIGLIDLVVVNVKPFAPEVGRGHIAIDEAIELIDVAGAALLGAAARNAAGVVAVPARPTTRAVLEELRTLGQVSADTRYRLAADAFSTVAAYYAEIAAYLNQISNNVYPQRLALVLEKVARPPVRREPAPARRLLPRDHPPLRHRSPTRPSSTARRRRSTT